MQKKAKIKRKKVGKVHESIIETRADLIVSKGIAVLLVILLYAVGTCMLLALLPFFLIGFCIPKLRKEFIEEWKRLGDEK